MDCQTTPHDYEVVADALIASVKKRCPKENWLIQSKKKENIFKLSEEELETLPGKIKIFADYRIYNTTLMAQKALVGWALGKYHGIKCDGEMPIKNMLSLQAEGKRAIGISVTHDHHHHQDRGFIHHDLCHLAKFYSPHHTWEKDEKNSDYHLGQVGFFRFIKIIYPLISEYVENSKEDENDLRYVISDMNGYVAFLFLAFLRRLEAQLRTI